MTGIKIIFIIVAAVTLSSAVMVVRARRMMHAALWLVLTLLGVAVLYGTLQAGFYTIVQILVYIGAISILIIFAIMLTRNMMTSTGSQLIRQWPLAAVVAAGMFIVLVVILSGWSGWNVPLTELPAEAEGIAEFGKALVDPHGYVIPFEVASVLLLAALVGAVYVAAGRKEGSK